MINKKIVAKAEIIELNEEYFVIRATNSQTFNNIKKNKGLIPNRKQETKKTSNTFSSFEF